jgi:hypothetical protein
VRHFWALAAIYVGFAVLLELVQFLGGNDRAQLVAALSQLARNQAAGRADDHALAHVFSQYAPAGGWTLAAFALAIFVLPLPTAAMAASASAFYLGSALNLGDAYRVAVRAWPQLLMVIVTYLAVGSVAYVGVSLVLFAVIFLVLLVAAASKLLAIALGIGLACAFLAFATAAALLAGLAYQVSFCTCVLEGASFWVAFGRGLRRVFRGVGLRRSLLAGLAYFAVLIGITMISTIGQAVLLGLIKSNVLGSIFAVIVNVAAGAFATVFLVLFYYDLRVREEGFDLQAVANALPAVLFPAG